MKTGTILKNKYRIDDPLGRGGMGEVYAGKIVGAGGFERDVAVKVLKIEDSSQEARFMDEARLWAQLHHPHIVQVIDFDRTERGRLFLVMERVFGRTLSEIELPLPESEVIFILEGLLKALRVAHGTGILHRDVALDNILIDDHRQVKLTDFGIALPTADQVESKKLRRLVGKIPYMSPEQAQGQPLSAESDLFSVGVVGYRLLTGRSPWGAGTDEAILDFIIGMEPFPIRSLQSDVSPELANVCHRLMQKDPQDRFASAQEVLNVIRSLRSSADETEILPSHPRKTLERVPPPLPEVIASRTLGRKLWGLALLFIMGLGAGMLWGRHDTEPVPAIAQAPPMEAARVAIPSNGSSIQPSELIRSSSISAEACVHDCAYVGEGSPPTPTSTPKQLAAAAAPHKRLRASKASELPTAKLHVGVRIFGAPSPDVVEAFRKDLRPYKRRIQRCFEKTHRSLPAMAQVGFIVSPQHPVKYIVPDGQSVDSSFLNCVLRRVPVLKDVSSDLRIPQIRELFLGTDKGAFDEGVLAL